MSVAASAEIKQVTLQASGLTCSMCSNAIFKALQKLPFAYKVTSNIKESSYTLTFKDEKAVDFDVIRKTVEGAGFSVAKMQVKANFDNVDISNDSHISLGGRALHFLNVKSQKLSGDQVFQIVDKNFVSDKTYKKYAANTKMECVKTGFMESCCKKDNKKTGTRIYHVTV